uniref:Uncharacterized protein n=1 Tax=Oryza punctata TaxID=4537 RepID=A0A0E0MCT2_ORYPU
MEIPNQISGGGSVAIEIPATEIVGVDVAPAQADESEGSQLHFTCGLPSGVFLSMSFVSFIYAVLAPWLLWRATDHVALMWTSSILACSYGALWTIALSEQKLTGALAILSRVSYVALVAFASTHLIGTTNGISIVYLDTFYVAVMLGYAVAEYRLRCGTEECPSAIVAKPPLDQEQEQGREVGLFYIAFLFSSFSLCVVGRMAWLLLFPCGSKCLISSVIEELTMETSLLFYVWVTFVSIPLLEGALVCFDTVLYKIPIYFGAWYVLGVLLGVPVGFAFEMLIFWIETMAMAGFFGYCLAVHAYCKRYHLCSSQDYFTFTFS